MTAWRKLLGGADGPTVLAGSLTAGQTQFAHRWKLSKIQSDRTFLAILAAAARQQLALIFLYASPNFAAFAAGPEARLISLRAPAGAPRCGHPSPDSRLSRF